MNAIDFVRSFAKRRDKSQENVRVKKNIWTDPSFDNVRRSSAFQSGKDQLDTYGDVAWIAIALDCITSDIGSRDYFFINNKTGVVLEDRQVPEAISLPFKNGFGNLSFKQIHAITTAHRILTGNALLWKMKKSAYGTFKDMTEQFAFIAPSRFKIITSPTGLSLEGYDVSLENGLISRLTRDQVVHLSQNNLKSAFIGIGNVEKIRLTIEGDIYADEFNNEFMSRKASPSLAITDEADLTDEQFERTKDIIRREYEGRQNSGKILYLAGGKVSITELGMSQRDIQFLEKKRYDRQTILSIFQVVPERAGLPDNSNRAIANQMLSQYYKGINGQLELNAGMFNQQHVHLINPDIDIVFDHYSTGEIELIAQMIQSGIISPNRGSELLGEDTDYENESLNKRYLPSNLLPIENLTDAPPATDPNAPAKHDHKKKDFILNNPKNVEQIIAHFYGDKGLSKRKFQAEFLRRALRTRNEIEDKYSYEFKIFFERQKNRVVEKLREHFNKILKVKEPNGETYRMIFDIKNEDEILSGEAKRIHTSAVQRSIMDIDNLMSASVNFSLSNPFVANAIKDLGSKLIGFGLNQFTQDELKGIIAQGISESWNIDQYQKAIEAKFEDFQGYRARMIARTESRAGYDAGANIAYDELGIKTIDVVGCTQFEPDSDCGATDVPVADIPNLTFHPNHIGSIVPSEQV